MNKTRKNKCYLRVCQRFYNLTLISYIKMEKEKNINQIVDKIKICKNEGHQKGYLIKYFAGNGKYICNNCGVSYNSHLDQAEKNSIVNYKPRYYKK